MMRNRLLFVLAGLVLITSVSLVVVGAQSAITAPPSWSPPLTADGRPDLHGVWVNNRATPLERPVELADRPLLTDAEVVQLQERADRLFKNGNSDHPSPGDTFSAAFHALKEYKSAAATQSSIYDVDLVFDNRTALVVDPPDGKIPSLTPEGQKRVAAVAAARQRREGPEDFSIAHRCITFGLPRLAPGNPYSSYYEIIQTSKYVVMNMETDVRVIPIDAGPHLPSTVRQWLGDSHAHWEGQTLVVDTTNFSSRTDFRGASENLHLVERFSRTAPNVLNYDITIDDLTTWTKPWTVSLRLGASTDKLYEFACHEGNAEVLRGMLAAARAEEHENASKR